ncbi:P-loop containing nucleoside triphosphate hydrolase [Trinorchestia longiramus]|nr:P-loop containing nucleoside triphosphate hydrolase [Trinorchestia longiramus]
MLDKYLKQSQDLDDHAVHLLFSANRWECLNSLKKRLQEGTTLIVDRYADSGIAFSAAKRDKQVEVSALLRSGIKVSEVAYRVEVSRTTNCLRNQTCWQWSKECCGSRQLARCCSKQSLNVHAPTHQEARGLEWPQLDEQSQSWEASPLSLLRGCYSRQPFAPSVLSVARGS